MLMLNRLRLSFFSIFPAITSKTGGHIERGISNMATDAAAAPGTTEIAAFASGCFWGTEHIFVKHYKGKGLVSSSVGFIGGKAAESVSYRRVCEGDTGHAEAVKLVFDPSVVKYEELVEFFYRTHDPTTKNKQGNDTGSQYRSGIFTYSDEQNEIARRVTDEVQKKHFDPAGKKIVTEIEPAGEWYEAEDYHQKYLFKNPNGYQCATHRLHW